MNITPEKFPKTEDREESSEQFRHVVTGSLDKLPEGHIKNQLVNAMIIVLGLLFTGEGVIRPALGAERPIDVSKYVKSVDDYVPSGPPAEITLPTMRGTKIHGFGSQGPVTEERFRGDDGQDLPVTGGPRIPNAEPKLVDLNQDKK